MNHTGPVPPTPTGASTDAQWQNWWAYQGVLRDLRYEDERAAAAIKATADAAEAVARQAVLDAQHREKMAREDACAAAQAETAAAIRYAADRAREPDPVTPWTDEQLVRQFMFNMADTVPQGTAAMGRAQAYLLALRAVFKPAPAPAPAPLAKDAP